MLGTRQHLARPPIVGDLVVIPLAEDGDLGIERTDIAVEKVVLVVATKLAERFRGLGLLLGDDILPDASVRHLLLGSDRAVGVNVVAAMDQEVRSVALHDGVGAHAAARLVYAPPLPGRIAGPHERYRAPIGRRGPETADGRLADHRWRG